MVSSPPIPLTPLTAVEGRYELKAEAMTGRERGFFVWRGGLMLRLEGGGRGRRVRM